MLRWLYCPVWFDFSFYENYLLPKVRSDIAKNGRLCVQLFEALIASLFRIREFLAAVFYPWIKESSFISLFLSHLLSYFACNPVTSRSTMVFFKNRIKYFIWWNRSGHPTFTIGRLPQVYRKTLLKDVFIKLFVSVTRLCNKPLLDVSSKNTSSRSKVVSSITLRSTPLLFTEF